MTYDDFLPHVLPYTQGCPDSVARDHIVKAARAFCAGTLVWQTDSQPIQTIPNVAIYPLDLDDGQERVKIIGASLRGRGIAVVNSQNGRAQAHGQRGGDYIWLEGPLDFGIYPMPSGSLDDIVVTVAVKPTLTSTEWPDDLAEYVDDIAHGAAASLCLLPRQEWTNADVASVQYRVFQGRMVTVARNVQRGFSQAGRGRRPSRML